MLQTYRDPSLNFQLLSKTSILSYDRVRQGLALAFLLAFHSLHLLPSSAVVYEWEYIDPANPNLGKQESNTLVPDGATADITSSPFGLRRLNLTKAYLAGTSLREFRLGSAILDDAYLAGADLYRVSGTDSPGNLSAKNADFSGASLVEVRFQNTDLSMAKFVAADLSGAILTNSVLVDADFTDAVLAGAVLSSITGNGFTAAQFYSTSSYKSRDLREISFALDDLQGWDFTGQQLVGAEFNNSLLAGAIFDEANIQNAYFAGSDLSSAQLYATASYKNHNLGSVNFSGRDLTGWDFSQQSMVQADLDRAKLTNTDFSNADLSFARITEAELSNAIFNQAVLEFAALGGGQFNVQSDVNFRGANLSQAIFDTNGRWERADFTEANLEGARLSNNGFVDSIFTDAIIRGAELESTANFGFTLQNLYSTASYKSGDLTNIRIRYGDLAGADFAGKNLSGASLVDLELAGADFRGANLTEAGLHSSFDGADFRGADLTDAGLIFDPVSFVDFRGANLTGAAFERTSLVNADFTDAIVYGTRLSVENSPQDLSAQQLYSTKSYKDGMLGPITLAGDMQGWDFRNQDLTGARFDRNSNLEGALWDGATLDGTRFFVNSLQNADFSSANTRNVLFTSSDLTAADFRGNDLTEAEINGNLTGTNFTGANMQFANVGGNLTNTNFTAADLRHARIRAGNYDGAVFTNADLRFVNLEYATDDGFSLAQLMTTRSYQDRDLTGSDLEGNEFANADFSNFELSQSIFSFAVLTDASFASSNLTGANFDYSMLGGTIFTDAILRGATFRGTTREGFTKEQLYSTRSYQQADLQGIDLRNNTLSGWDFQNLNLTGANFEDSDLFGANFTGAVIEAANFSNTPASNSTAVGITQSQLISTKSFQKGMLVGVDLSYADLSGLQLTGFVLNGINLSNARLNTTDFTGAQINGAALRNATAGGFTAQQLYSTASYQQKDLRGVDFLGNAMGGWNLEDQNLMGAYFDRNPQSTTIRFARADLRGAAVRSQILSDSSTANTILPDGSVHGLNLRGPVRMLIRNFDPITREDYLVSRPPLLPSVDDPISIKVDTSFSMDQDSRLQIEFTDQPWISTIAFQENIPVDLDGTLELSFARGIDPRSQIGEVFRVFDWTGVNPSGQFRTILANPPGHSDFFWDLSNLYFDGTVQLVAAVPEPVSALLLLAGLLLNPVLLRPSLAYPLRSPTSPLRCRRSS